MCYTITEKQKTQRLFDEFFIFYIYIYIYIYIKNNKALNLKAYNKRREQELQIYNQL